MIDQMKPLGAFIENTIRPLLDEVQWFFEECDKRNIPVSKENINIMINFISDCWVKGLIIKLIQNVIIALIIGFVVCKTYQ